LKNIKKEHLINLLKPSMAALQEKISGSASDGPKNSSFGFSMEPPLPPKVSEIEEIKKLEPDMK
jgi:hypothetical protein